MHIKLTEVDRIAFKVSGIKASTMKLAHARSAISLRASARANYFLKMHFERIRDSAYSSSYLL